MKKKVMVGMSGGVDSSVAAAVLLEKGYEVVGMTMQIWPDQDEETHKTEGGCCSLSAVDDARRVCNVLGIPYYVMNFKEVFEKKVITYFLDEYIAGKTPNPCIACNRHIKFDALLNKALALGMDYVATGHYAKIEYDHNLKRYLLKKSVTAAKDQTYALYNMNQMQLEHVLMPIGSYTKEETRSIAERLRLPVAHKPDSQEICFVADDDYGRFLEENRPDSVKPGNFVDVNGKVLGTHRGIVHYTIGQRKGLGVAFGKPMFVVEIRPKTNEVVLGEQTEVFSDTLIAHDTNFIPFDKLEGKMEVTAKIRYSAREARAFITPLDEGKVRVQFEEPQRAITPGQSVVFYQGDIVVGGGVIS